MNNGIDKQVCAFTRVVMPTMAPHSSQDYGDPAKEDNTLLSADVSSISSFSSEGCSGFNAGLESDRDSEIGAANPGEIVEAVLGQPVSSSLRISSSEVHLGPSLTYNGPVTINVTVQSQANNQTTPQPSDPQTDSQPEPQTQLEPQQQLQKEYQPHQLVSEIQRQDEIQQPPQHQQLSQPQIQSQIPQQQVLSQAQEQPPSQSQEPSRKQIPRTKRPHSVLQLNLQTTYGQDFRGVKPAGCLLLAEHLTRKESQWTELEVDDGGACPVMSWLERNLAIIALLVMIVTVFGIVLTLVIRYRLNGSASPDVRVPTSMANGTPMHLKQETENQQHIKSGGVQEDGQKLNAHKEDKPCKDTKDCSGLLPKNEELRKQQHQNTNGQQILRHCQYILVMSTESPPSIVSSEKQKEHVLLHEPHANVSHHNHR